MEHSIEVLQEDMAEFDLRRKFDTIILPSSAVYCLEDLQSVISCFESVRRHLNRDGEVIFDAYNVNNMDTEDWDWVIRYVLSNWLCTGNNGAI